MEIEKSWENEIEEEWNKMPLYMGYEEIVSLGFKKSRVYKWFCREDFPPMIHREGKRVNKYKLRKWIEEREETADAIL